VHGNYLPKKPKKVLILGSGALKIGEAGEFDYSGSQAIKAIREEGISTVLINPNIATIQTSEGMADRTYFLPVTPHFVEEVIKKEQVDALLLGFGGQTALNCGVSLDESGVLEKLGVRVLGTPASTIRNTEDRRLFVQELDSIEVYTARAEACSDIDQARTAALDTIGLPVILRGAFSLGGRGSAIVKTPEDLENVLPIAFAGCPQVLVEESLEGWKEIEYEVVRDARDNCITVCNMENVDPMGIHTGESIVVAPSQTLNNHEYHMLREISIRTIRHLGIVGECNIQFALDPQGDTYRVIEVNARLSRSSALASKATGYPLAYIAAKLSLGYTMAELTNMITQRTCAFFEPALDYIVVKTPRWDLDKFTGAESVIGSEMKSVGEVMSIGRTFTESLQKALRMVGIGVNGLDPEAFNFKDIEKELTKPSPRRIFCIAHALEKGMDVETIHNLTGVDRWFLHEIDFLVHRRRDLKSAPELTEKLLRQAKREGFSDRYIADLRKTDEEQISDLRRKFNIRPVIKQIDTLAGEFPAETNYLYLTYHGEESDIAPSWRKKVMVLGSGPYHIGSSVEFDWCCVNAAQAARDLGYETVLLNFNPETVSTDTDTCDKLIFDEISFETVKEIYDAEQPWGVIVSVGGQVANNLALRLEKAGIRILGTSARDIDAAEDRNKFSSICDELGINQPKWAEMNRIEDLEKTVNDLEGLPILVRPSYVLSGAAMTVAHNIHHLQNFLNRAADVSPDHPVVLTKFEQDSKEIEFDAVADQGEVILWAISEHVENAGVHSGDATLVLPPQKLYLETVRQIKNVAKKLAKRYSITGPFNLQFLAKNNQVKVIELNLRASRSFPFVSKVTGSNLIHEATRRILGVKQPVVNRALDLDYVGVKAAQFSFARIKGADPTLGVEMASTGEVGCFGINFHAALLKALISTGFRIPQKGVLLSLGPVKDKYRFFQHAKVLIDMGLKLYATGGTADVLNNEGIEVKAVGKKSKPMKLMAQDVLDSGDVDLVINIPIEYDELGRPDGYFIRRHAADMGIPLVTNLQLAMSLVEAMERYRENDLEISHWGEYLETLS